MRRAILAAVLASGMAAGSVPAIAQPDLATQGEAAFKALGCGSCHIAGEGDQAPWLGGVAGRKIGGVMGFPYCESLAKKGGSWDDSSLDAFLADTQAFAPGCAMSFKVEPAQRKALIAYLKTLK